MNDGTFGSYALADVSKLGLHEGTETINLEFRVARKGLKVLTTEEAFAEGGGIGTVSMQADLFKRKATSTMVEFANKVEAALTKAYPKAKVQIHL